MHSLATAAPPGGGHTSPCILDGDALSLCAPPAGAPTSRCVHCDTEDDPCPRHPAAPRYSEERGTDEWERWRAVHPVSTWPPEWLHAAGLPVPEVPPAPLEEILHAAERAAGEAADDRLRRLLADAYATDPRRTERIVRTVVRDAQKLRSPFGVLVTRLRQLTGG